MSRAEQKPAMVREETVGYGGAVVLYHAPDGKVELDVRLEQESLWLNLNQIASLFGRDKSVISRHLRNIYETSELDRPATVAFFATREKFGGSALFGREKDASLSGSLSAVMQTFGGRDVYPSIEEKAAHLLYFLVKNHSFVDGNKRIAAALFLWFMEKNGVLYAPGGAKCVSDTALVALTLMVAESHPDQKKILTQLIANLLHEKE